jgi:hypothetical protein
MPKGLTSAITEAPPAITVNSALHRALNHAAQPPIISGWPPICSTVKCGGLDRHLLGRVAQA